jgi:hypothetical protein
MFGVHKMKIIEKEFNALTGEETITEREETATEKKEREELQAEIAIKLQEAEAKAAAKSALLDKLGITAEEAVLLLS